ncbi:3-oxoacyl-reductase [Phyllosticta citricarpa]|uniref:3-oxoacyl-reductase n=2 Tax=Phyllosticta TaxID=121621 RepID=A0ABR1MHK3_9PEZI
MAARSGFRNLIRHSNALSSASRAPLVGPKHIRSIIGVPEQQRKTAIVTGCAQGIGKAIALRLAQDGYDIGVNDIPSNKDKAEQLVSEIKELGQKATVCLGDVSKLDEVENMVQTSVKELGPLNTMVANAGIAQVKPLLQITPEELRRIFEINVFGAFNCYSTAAKQMISQGSGGKLIGAASIVSLKPFAMLGHYSATKFAVRGLTQVFAMEMARHKITANAYAPGIVGTSMWDLIDEKIGEETGAKKGDTIKKYSGELIALGRTSVPTDVSKAVSFLAGPDSDYVTGQTLVVDGGIIFT